MYNFVSPMITPIIMIPRQKLAIEAVRTLDVNTKRASAKSNLGKASKYSKTLKHRQFTHFNLGTHPTINANIAANPPTTTP